MRSKLFLSYSRADSKWRERFCRQLHALVMPDDLWVDLQSIEGGQDWESRIDEALAEARCALVLVTPAYLDLDSYSRRELGRLAQEQQRGLVLLPVLVADCPWQSVPALAKVQFLRWQGGTRRVPADLGEREELKPLDEAGRNLDRAVVELCEQVKKTLGVVAQTTPQQMDELAADVRRVLGGQVNLDEPIHSGEFSVLYRARLGGEPVVVKAVPEAPRRNRIRALLDSALPKLKNLRDPAFIRILFAAVDAEPHCLVMDHVEWPTLQMRLGAEPEHRLAPRIVARVLAQVARAQDDAHANDLQIGPLSPASIYVDEQWNIRLSALRIEGLIARAANMTMGQLMNWDALTHLAPEISEGLHPATREELDALEQYYLGLLGLELLLGRPPSEVRRFDDLMLKARFFEHPRPFFGDAPGGNSSWTEECPALAFVITRMLARDPAERFASTETAMRALDAIADSIIPDCLRKQLYDDLEMLMQDAFAIGLYRRLFDARPGLRMRFHAGTGSQARMLAQALPDLVDFNPQRPLYSRYQALARKHADYGLDAADVQAFRRAFVDQVKATFPDEPAHGDAWNAVLKVCLGHLLAGSEGRPEPAAPSQV